MLFSAKNRSVVFLLLLAVLSLVILSYNVVHAPETGIVRKLVLELASPVEMVVHGISAGLHDTWSRYLFLVGLGDENRRLHRQDDLLKQRLIEYQEAYMEAARLRGLLDLKRRLVMPTVAAEIIGSSRASIFRTLLINKGTSDGIFPGMAVVSNAGVVGRITDASWDVSRVLLMIDENSNVDALVQGSRAQGILQGGGSKACLLKYVSMAEDVRPGMAVVTSGMGGFFPKGLLLGVVVRVSKKEGGLFQTVEVAPAVDFKKIEEVLVFREYRRNMQ
jgi:rod shape-determining protein MreC